MRPRCGATAAFGVALALAAGGCGDPGQEVQADGDGVAALLAAADATDAEGSYRVRVAVASDDADCAPVFEDAALEAVVDLDSALMSVHLDTDEGEGDLVATEHAVLVSAALAPAGWGVESGWVEIAESDDLALMELTGHLEVAIAPNSDDAQGAGATSGWMRTPTDLLHEVEALASSVEATGTEDVDGRPTTRYAIEVDPDAYAQRIEDDIRAQMESTSLTTPEGQAGTTVPTQAEIEEAVARARAMTPVEAIGIDVWVDTDGLVRRFVVRQPAGGMFGIDLTATADFTDYGVEAAAPDRSDVVTFASLGVEPNPLPDDAGGEDIEDIAPDCELLAEMPGSYDEPYDFEDETFSSSPQTWVEVAESMGIDLTEEQRRVMEGCGDYGAAAFEPEPIDPQVQRCFELLDELMPVPSLGELLDDLSSEGSTSMLDQLQEMGIELTDAQRVEIEACDELITRTPTSSDFAEDGGPLWDCFEMVDDLTRSTDAG